MIRSNEQEVILLLAALVDLTNSLVGCSNTNDSGLVNTSVANHIRGSKVVHHELELALLNTLAHLFSDASSAHLRSQVVGSNTFVGWDEILLLVSDFEREDLLNSSVEEESDMGIFLGLGDVDLGDALATKSFSKDIAHVLWLESNLERVVELVLGHGGESDVLGVWEVFEWRTVNIAEKLGDFSDTVRSVVEEEYLIAI